MHSPTTLHWIAIKRILRCLKFTYADGLVYQPSPMTLMAFSNADYAGDLGDRKSIGG